MLSSPWELTERCSGSLRRARRRRQEAARLRRRRLRVRGSGASFTAVVLAIGALGAGAAVGQQSAEPAGVAALLKAGSSGEAVAAVQRALGARVDGVFGARTAAQVRSFQRRRGLQVDGIVGPQTRAALGLAGAATRATSRSAAAQPQRGSGDRGASAPSAALQRIAQCESGGNPRAIGGGGAYRGKYQFSRETWRAVGGSGDPAAAPEAEQDRRAATLYARSGPSQWPSCAG